MNKNNKENNNFCNFSKAFLIDDNIITNLFKITPLDVLYNILMQNIINNIALKQREGYLYENPSDSANGFYPRTLYYGNIPLNINIPRTRSSNFYPDIVPKYKRSIPSTYEKLVESIILNARSIESAKRAIRELNLPVNNSVIEEIIKEYAEYLKNYLSRELESDWLVVFADAKTIEVKDKEKVKKKIILTSVGINMKGQKEILGSETYEGNETIEKWREFLLNLKNRGLTRVLLFVTDNFQGLTKLIKGLFPQAMHQLCIVHLMRNGKLHLKKEDYKYFIEEIKRIEKIGDYEEAYSEFIKLTEWLKEKGYKHFSKELNKKAENFVMFTRFPEEIRSRIKSTNASENLHKELERIKRNSGGYFQSMRILECKWGIFINNLRENSWKNPEPKFKNVLAKLHNMFKEIYESEVII